MECNGERRIVGQADGTDFSTGSKNTVFMNTSHKLVTNMCL